MLRLLFLVPLLPLIGAIINGVFGRAFRFTERTVAAIACGATGLSLLVALGAIIDYSTP
jgi:NADH:ubiquinone oxidoreductase subunit 5 (subunit L)/multisubunit Na+/H+ antiporter MnhA subunit